MLELVGWSYFFALSVVAVPTPCCGTNAHQRQAETRTSWHETLINLKVCERLDTEDTEYRYPLSDRQSSCWDLY